MTVDARHLADNAQLAAGVVAAKHRGDLAGAEELLSAFGSDVAAAGGFLTLAEVALGLVRAQTGQSMDELVQELSLLIGTVLGAPEAN